MPAKKSCWTCRLRHKKCDGVLPTCGQCRGLEIRCFTDDQRPRWMDGGYQEKERRRLFSAEVKRSAKRRRGVSRMETIAHDLAQNSASQDSQEAPASPEQHVGVVSGENGARCKLQKHGLAVASPPGRSTRSQHPSNTESQKPSHVLGETEMRWLMGFLDYAFPVLFPFYAPNILEGGRAWLPALAAKHKAFYDAIVALSSYFFSSVPVMSGSIHRQCLPDTWAEVSERTTSMISVIQRDLRLFKGPEAGACPRESVRLFATIMQMLHCEHEMFDNNSWQAHFEAALGLLQQVLVSHGRDTKGGRMSIDNVYNRLADQSSQYTMALQSTEQAAFRFYSSLLVMYDIITSTTLDRSPVLRPFLADDLCSSNSGLLQSLSNLAGCEAWVFVIIGDVSDLDAWKRSKMVDGHTGWLEELVHRAKILNIRLESSSENSSILSSKNGHHLDENMGISKPLEHIMGTSTCSFGFHPHPSRTPAAMTELWAHACRLYLFIIQSSSPKGIHYRDLWKPTDELIERLDRIQPASWLRCLIWPIYMAGIAADMDQRLRLRAIMDRMEALKGLQSVSQLDKALQTYWESHTQAEYFDFSICLRDIDMRLLLV